MDNSIQTLPVTTVRALGSSHALADPAAIAKELIDNALDAGATSVSLDIAANTVDTIQARDDGHGVAPDNRAMLCKSHCTSKIRDFSDIQQLGGRYLGFRGEALACIVEMSDSVTLTTRVKGEEVATMTHFQRQASNQRSETCSHPIGTTVRVSDVFRPLPVRRQTAVKNAVRCLSELKRIVQGYAFARPSVRFSLRILKSATGRDGLVYVPQKDANLRDATIKLVGSACAGQCVLQRLEYSDYVLTALIPKHDAATADLSHTGPFISVDGRPLAHKRGVSKDMSTKLKGRLRSTNSEYMSVKSPFMCLQVQCPIGSYDPNLEPSKDDVVWKDSRTVLDAFEKLLDQTYGSLPIPKLSTVHRDTDGGLDDPLSNSKKFEVSRTAQVRQARHPPDMYAPGYQLGPKDTEEDASNICFDNPWVKAKMNARIRPEGMPLKSLCRSQPPLQESAAARNRCLPRSPAQVLPPHPPWKVATPPTSPTTASLALSRSQAPISLPYDRDVYEEHVLQHPNDSVRSEQRLNVAIPQPFVEPRQVPMDVYMRKRPLPDCHATEAERHLAPSRGPAHDPSAMDDDLLSLYDRREAPRGLESTLNVNSRTISELTVDNGDPPQQHEFDQRPAIKRRKQYHSNVFLASRYNGGYRPIPERSTKNDKPQANKRFDTYAGSSSLAQTNHSMLPNRAVPLEAFESSQSEAIDINKSSMAPPSFLKPASFRARTTASEQCSEHDDFLELEEPWSSLCQLMLHSHISIPEIAYLCQEIENQWSLCSNAGDAQFDRTNLDFESSTAEMAGKTGMADVDAIEYEAWKRKARQLVQQVARETQATSGCLTS